MKQHVDRYEYQCLNDAKDILISIDMPSHLTNPRSVMTLAALAEMCTGKKPWVSAGILEPKAGLATNDKDNSYRFTSYFASLIRTYGTNQWKEKLADYNATHTSYAEYLKQTKEVERDYRFEYEGIDIALKKSEHNKLQVQILQMLIPLVSKSKPELLYIGDAVDRDLSLDEIKEHLKNNDDYVVRIKSPGDMSKQVTLHDLIKGDITMPENVIDEVIMKKDGLPTYHFAHVIDDHLMHTTVVIRGDEWVPSYPKHLQLFQLMGFKLPKYAHYAPLTKKENGNIRKLSKRKDPEFSVSYYDEAGIPSEGVKLFLSTIINTNFEEWYLQNSDKSYLDFQFSFKKMPTGGTLFDTEKLNNICRTYFSRISASKIYEDSLTYFKKYDEEFYNIMVTNKDRLIDFLDIERNGKRPRKDIATYKDVKSESMYMFNEYFYKDKEETYKEIDKAGIDVELLHKYLEVFDEHDDNDTWYSKIQNLATENNYAPSTKEYKASPESYKGHIGNICEMIRHVVTGKNQTPNLSNILSILGKEEISKRISFFEN